MIPEISEFSYGFALTNELIGWDEVKTAPIFPSLIEEGKEGGGYDVKLDFPGVPFYIQFKRSECMTRHSSREYKLAKAKGGSLGVPYYRFSITDKYKSNQHDMLIELDVSPNHVYYAAPRFHRLHEINSAWNDKKVASRSVFVPPSQIGFLDDHPHAVAFDQSVTWICSEPKVIHSLTSRQVLDRMKQALKSDEKPLREKLPLILEGLHNAEERGRKRIAEKIERDAREAEARRAVRALQRQDGREENLSFIAGPLKQVDRAIFEALESPEPSPVQGREPNPIDAENMMLRKAADIAAHVFNAQLVIVQPK